MDRLTDAGSGIADLIRPEPIAFDRRPGSVGHGTEIRQPVAVDDDARVASQEVRESNLRAGGGPLGDRQRGDAYGCAGVTHAGVQVTEHAAGDDVVVGAWTGDQDDLFSREAGELQVGDRVLRGVDRDGASDVIPAVDEDPATGERSILRGDLHPADRQPALSKAGQRRNQFNRPAVDDEDDRIRFVVRLRPFDGPAQASHRGRDGIDDVGHLKDGGRGWKLGEREDEQEHDYATHRASLSGRSTSPRVGRMFTGE